MQNDGKLASDGNLCFAQSASLREPDAPGFKVDHFATRVSSTLAAS